MTSRTPADARSHRPVRSVLTTSAAACVLALLLGLLPLGLGGERASAVTTAKDSNGARIAKTLGKSRIPTRAVGRLWNNIGRSPSLAEINRNAPRYDVIILNAWDTAQLRRIRQVNPRALVLVYKCLASTRSYTDARLVPAGLRYQDAAPSWFATTSAGRRISWNPYPGHWQMATWNAGYRAAWVRNVTREVVSVGWDGVLADNDMQTLKWYTKARVAGASSQAASDAKVRAGLGQLVNAAGASLNARGKLLVPNISDGRLDLGRWSGRSRWGGGMEEQFSRFGYTRGQGYVTDWGRTGWVDQTKQLKAPLTLALTSAAPGDKQALRYGFASAAVRAAGRVAWAPHQVVDYSRPERFAWQDVRLGRPGKVRRAKGTWSRSFKRAWIVVNPTDKARKVRVPKRYGGGTVRVRAKDARLVRR